MALTTVHAGLTHKHDPTSQVWTGLAGLGLTTLVTSSQNAPRPLKAPAHFKLVHPSGCPGGTTIYQAVQPEIKAT